MNTERIKEKLQNSPGFRAKALKEFYKHELFETIILDLIYSSEGNTGVGVHMINRELDTIWQGIAVEFELGGE